MNRFPMGTLLLIVVVGVWLLAIIDVVGGLAAVVVTFVALVVGIVFLDLTTRGSGKAIRDPNAPTLYGPIGGGTWQVPTAYIDHPTGPGRPPGVGDDMEDVRRISGERRPTREDVAP